MGGLSKAKWCLLGCLIIVIVFLAGSVFIPGGLTNAVEWVANNGSARKLRGLSETEASKWDTLIEIAVETVVIGTIDYQPVVILKEKDGDLHLPIWISPLEVNAISVVLERAGVRRALTPDLLCSIVDRVDRMEASIDYIVINDIYDNTFYADIGVNFNWTQVEIDACLSDAIAIALRVRVPIYVEKSVLDKAGIQPDYETGE